MNKFLCFFLLCALNVCNVSCQTQGEQRYVLSNEYLKKKTPQAIMEQRRGISGVVHNKLVIFGRSNGLTEEFFLYDERSQVLSPFLTLQNTSDKVLGLLAKDNKLLKNGYLSIPDMYKEYRIEDIPIDSLPYQDFWIEDGNVKVKIDSYPFHYVDKAYDTKFSFDGKSVIVNPYTDVSAGYWAENDNRIYIYDLVDIKKSQVQKQTIRCDQCMNANLIGNKIIFVKEIEIGGGRDGYYKNIYIAPKNNIDDTVKIAHDINIIQLSPDGKFILGEKYLHGKYTPVIVDVASKRFQYLLGRKYPMAYSFYSPYEKKFAFDFQTHFVYINFPDSYPFDALNQKSTQSSKTEDAAFWKKYQHEALR